MDKIKKFFGLIYTRLFKIDDSPQRVALGFGLGVFLGIFPGTGPFAAVILSILLRLNRAAALVGCLATNTWISVIVFVLAAHLGSLLFGMNWKNVQAAPLKFVLPISTGYILIGLALGALTYLVTIFILKLFKRRKDGFN